MIEKIIHDSWFHPWEGFNSSFESCSQKEIEWVSQFYEKETTTPNWPKNGTISWILNHVGAYKQTYIYDILHPDSSNNEPEWIVHRDLQSLKTALNKISIEFSNACLLADPEIFIHGKGGHNLAQYIGIALRHEIWHAGQIALIRRMFANQF